MREELKPITEIAHEPLPNGALEGTHELIQGVLKELEKRYDASSFELIELDYRLPAKRYLAENPRQVALTIALASPGSNFGQGLLNPGKTEILIGERAKTDWGASSFAPPMGKIEGKDTDGNELLGHAILEAAYREFSEEVEADSNAGQSIIAGSFQDKSTGMVIHVVLRHIGENRRGGNALEVKPKNEREHKVFGWTTLRDFPSLKPVMPGTAFALKTGLAFLDKRNREVAASGRYQDQI